MSKFLIGNIKGPKGDKGEQGAVGPKGEQGLQGPIGPAGGVNSVNKKTGDVTIEDALGYTPEPQHKQKEVTLSAQSWTGDKFPFLYDITLEGVGKDQFVLVTTPPGLTLDDIKAFSDACITGKEQVDNKITLQAVNKPTMDLKILIEIGGVVTNG